MGFMKFMCTCADFGEMKKIVENGGINSNVIVWVFFGELARTLSGDEQKATCSQNDDA